MSNQTIILKKLIRVLLEPGILCLLVLCNFSNSIFLREAAKKGIFLMAVPLRPYSAPPLELNGSRKFVIKLESNFFFLMTSPLTPPPLMTQPLRKKLFLAFLKYYKEDQLNIVHE